jgi:hypothetical protein
MGPQEPTLGELVEVEGRKPPGDSRLTGHIVPAEGLARPSHDAIELPPELILEHAHGLRTLVDASQHKASVTPEYADEIWQLFL